MKCVHVLITGSVQGVGFRFFTQREAQRLDVRGWVRNLPRGAVEAHFEGEARAVDAMVQQVHLGPRHAVVQAVTQRECEPELELDGFEIR
jgi:acylphosphatase